MTDTFLVLLIALSVLASAGNLLVSLWSGRRVELVHRATNSMKDELVEATRVAALATGVIQGAMEEKARQEDKGP